MTFRDPDHYTLEEFEDLLADKPHDEKWELIGGRLVHGMVGAKWEHAEIASNIHVALKNHIRAKALPCRVFQESFWVKQDAADIAFFPDVLVRCGAMSPGQTSVDDPKLVVEVVSKGSGYRDRVEKKALYQSLPSVDHILLVAVDAPSVVIYSRLSPDSWREESFSQFSDVVACPTLDFSITLAEIYRDVIAA